MKIVADENIPLVEYYFGSLGQLQLKPGRAITRDDVKDADILLVRSVTQVDQKLLQDSTVRFVGSATTGADHLDLSWLAQQGIPCSVASGCNSKAVVEYVLSVIAALQKQQMLTGSALRAAVIGVGVIGSQIANLLKILGFSVVLCDPLRAKNENNFANTPLVELADLDFITLHTPLTYEGIYPTYHMLDKNFFQRQRAHCVLLNTSRGSVINFADLKQYGQSLHWCLDVWEDEPNIDIEVLQKALIATPHIAGYSVQSKYRGIAMIYQAAIKLGIISSFSCDIVPYPRHEISFANQTVDWRDVVLSVYNPAVTTQLMKARVQQNATEFDIMRKQFTERHELAFTDLCEIMLNPQDLELISKLRCT